LATTIGHNKLAAVPDALGDLDALSDFLYLHDNRLRSLPPSLQRLKKMRYLNIGENAFEGLPDCVCGMSGPIELRVCSNELTSLPEPSATCHGCASYTSGTIS